MFYQIGQISKLCNIPIRTLHHYDEIDLLKPAKIDEESKYRYYSHSQLMEINTIKYFKRAGFSLKQIKKLIQKSDLKYSKKMIQDKNKEIELEIMKLESLKKKLSIYLDKLDNSNQKVKHNVEITVKEVPVSYVAYSRYKGPCNDAEFYLRFTKLNNIIEKNNLEMTGTMMAIYHDDYKEFDYSSSDIEVFVNVDENGKHDENVKKFGGFLGAIAYHYGSYKTMNETYREILIWIEKNNFTFTGGAIENYIVDGITTSCEDEYLTEIILPIKNID